MTGYNRCLSGYDKTKDSQVPLHNCLLHSYKYFIGFAIGFVIVVVYVQTGRKTFRILSPDFAKHVHTISPSYGVMENGLSFQYPQDTSALSDVNSFSHFSVADNMSDEV